MKFARYDAPLFDRSVVACFECDEYEALNFFRGFTLRESNGHKIELRDVSGAKGWCQVDGGDIYLWARDEWSVLLHEVVHAAFRLCDLTDIERDEELIARLVESMKVNLLDQLKEME